MIPHEFWKGAGLAMGNPMAQAAPRPEVPGLTVPRTPTAKLMPQDLGRGKGTVPTNPFRGNWQMPTSTKVSDLEATKDAAGAGFGERAGRAIGGFVGKHPILTLAGGYLALRTPEIVQALQTGRTHHRPYAGYATVHGARGLMSAAEQAPPPAVPLA